VDACYLLVVLRYSKNMFTEAWDILECISCEQLVFPGEEVEQTPEGVICSVCLAPNPVLATVSE
jgi:hypothetical protein